MWKIECPNCHHLFSVVTEESAQLIDDEKAEDIKESVPEKIEEGLDNLVPFSRRVPGSFGRETEVDDLTYEYKFKCKNCGHEWTELREKDAQAEVRLPRRAGSPGMSAAGCGPATSPRPLRRLPEASCLPVSRAS